MKQRTVGLLGIALVATSFTVAPAGDPGTQPQRVLVAGLSGLQEVPAVITEGQGRFRATLDRETSVIDYVLDLQHLEGTVTQIHVHVGQANVNGDAVAFLCTNLGNGPAGTQACSSTGSITGTIIAADVVGDGSQGVGPGEIDALMNAIVGGAAYVNVHTDDFPDGEIRGQLGVRIRKLDSRPPGGGGR